MVCRFRRCFRSATCAAIAGLFAAGAAPVLAQQPSQGGAPATAPPRAGVAPVPAVQVTPAGQKAAPQPAADIYDTKADARVQIAAALKKAKAENQRVLIMYGGNWCGWCQKLHGLYKSNAPIAKELLYEYQLVMVDIGRFDKHLDVAKDYGVDLKKSGMGVPYLTVLDADGKVLTNQDTGALEVGDKHDPAKVSEFLKKWQAEPREAEKVLADALTRAKSEQKNVFLHFGAPWCGWCKKLEAFLDREDIAPLIAADFVDVKIDTERMKAGADVFKRYEPTQKTGIPWIALLDAEGKVLADSNAEKGNIGFPSEPAEIEHFMGMLKKTTKRLSAEQFGRIETALEKERADMDKQRDAAQRQSGQGPPAGAGH